ncbi:MAG: hypothetical protein V1775_06105 [Bacteroidota bacterium]
MKMQDNNDKIKKLAGSVLSRFEAEPPPEMWSRIERQLHRQKRLILFRMIAMAASVFILMGVGFSLLLRDHYRNNSEQDYASQYEKSKHGDPAGDTKKRSDTHYNGVSGSGPAQGNTNLPAKPAEKRKSISSSQQEVSGIPVETTPDPDSSNEQYMTGSVGLIEVTEPVGLAELPESIEKSDESIKIIPPAGIVELKQGITEPLKQDEQPALSGDLRKSSWSLSLGYGSSSSFEMVNDESALKSSNSNYSHDELSAEVANRTSYFDEVENTTHDAPLSLGFIISKKTGRRLFAETGLLYTSLGYRLKTAELNGMYQEYSNRLHYLGIPLGLRFVILERKRFGIYAAQSVIIEKGIISHSYIQSYTRGELSGSETDKVNVRGIQLSSLTGLGSEIKIAGNISVYGQAGLQLFYLNGSQPYNIRSTRMAWPSFQLGLRMKLE